MAPLAAAVCMVMDSSPPTLEVAASLPFSLAYHRGFTLQHSVATCSYPMKKPCNTNQFTDAIASLNFFRKIFF